MARKLRQRLTYANVMATIAVFVALGGTGYAAIKLPKNSVKAKQIAAKAVQGSEAHNLTAADFKRGERAKLKGLKGDTGAQGATGAPGAPGAAGSARAYGHVSSTGALTKSKGVKSVTRRFSGVFCIILDDSINPATTPITVSTDASDGASTGSDTMVIAEGTDVVSSCTGGMGPVVGTDFVVKTFAFNGTMLADSSKPFNFVVP